MVYLGWHYDWLFKERTIVYQTMFYWEPHYAVWRMIRAMNKMRDMETSPQEIAEIFDTHQNKIKIILFDLEVNGSIKRQEGLEDFPLYVANDKFTFPRRRRIKAIGPEYGRIRRKTGLDSNYALRNIFRNEEQD